MLNNMTAATLYGTAPQGPAYGTMAPTQTMGTDTLATGIKALVDPNNPLMWFGLTLVIMVGAAAVSGNVRLGRAKLSASVGKA